MEVTALSDYDTHAIIGGGESQKFQMAQTGHFFEVLSKTLYANGRLAVIREVLCNAWDSHIASGVMGTAVDIILNNNELIIRDYGSGIPHDLIHEIYCIYGNSTKKNDGNQTGGFGLGSKAPFAYSDHFTITNMHKGTKVVHAISRGSIQSDGTPERRVIIDVPTTEQGVEVKIPIKDSRDIGVFEGYIKDVAKYGEMNVSLNGKKLPRWDLSTSTEGWIAASDEAFGVQTNSKIFVRYGNVIYPVEVNEAYANEQRIVDNFLTNLPSGNGWQRTRWCICFQAAPNTITVTPSRESLQITERTIETLKELFNKVKGLYAGGDYNTLRTEIVTEATQYLLKNSNKLQLLDGKSPFDASGKNLITPIKSMKDARQRHIRDKFTMKRDDWIYRLIELSKDATIKNRGTLQKVAKIGKKNAKSFAESYYIEPDLQEFVTRLKGDIRTALIADDRMDVKSLFFLAPGSRNKNVDYEDPWKKNSPRLDRDNFFNLLKNKVFLTYTKQGLSENIQEIVKDHGDFGSWDGCFCYVVPRKKNAYKDAIEFFTKANFDIIDVDAYIQKNNLVKERPVSTVPSAPKVLGIPSVKCLSIGISTYDKTKEINIRGHLTPQAPRIENPEWVVTAKSMSGQEWNHSFFEAKLDKIAKSVLHLFGETGGVCVNVRQKEKYIRDGSKDAYEYFGDKLFEEFDTNPALVDYFGGYHLHKSKNAPELHLQLLWKLQDKFSSIKKILNYPRLLTETEEHWVRFYWHLTTRNQEKNYSSAWAYEVPEKLRTSVRRVDALIEASEDKQQYLGMLPRVQTKILSYVNLGDILTLLNDPKTSKKDKDEAEAILLLALEG